MTCRTRFTWQKQRITRSVSVDGEDGVVLKEKVPQRAVFIIGAGHFGSRAARLISKTSRSTVFLLDQDEDRLAQFIEPSVVKIRGDGIDFLVKNHPSLQPENRIVPAVPLHLAFEWLKRSLRGTRRIRKIRFPQEAGLALPHSWMGSEWSLLVSYADFLCPDDCPEPFYCTVTGQKREEPMHDLLKRLDLEGFGTHVIRSRQLAPGLGGYRFKELLELREKMMAEEPAGWILGTACRCHGVLTAFQLR
jgi:hypothetical protein